MGLDKYLTYGKYLTKSNTIAGTYDFVKDHVPYLNMTCTLASTDAQRYNFDITLRLPDLKKIVEPPTKLAIFLFIRSNLCSRADIRLKDSYWSFNLDILDDSNKIVVQEDAPYNIANATSHESIPINYKVFTVAKITFFFEDAPRNPEEELLKMLLDVIYDLNGLFVVCQSCGYEEGLLEYRRAINGVVYPTREVCQQLTDEEFLRGLNHEN